jgi:hypothetical protein
VRHPGLTLCAAIIIRRDFRALLERTNPEERRATGPYWIHFRAQDVRNPLVERPFNWFKSPLGHDIFPHPCVVSTDEAQSAGRDAGTVIDAIEDRAERWHYRA